MRVLFSLFALASAGLFKKKLTTIKKNKDQGIGEVFVGGGKVFGAGAANPEMGCRALPRGMVTSSSDPRIKVCGSGIKVVTYLLNNCQKEHSKTHEVGHCDSAKPATACVEVAPGKGGAPLGFNAYRSYEITHC